MGVYLFVLLLLLTIINLFIVKFNVIHPTFLMKLGWLISSFIFVLNYRKWNTSLEFKTLLIIVGGILIFDLGSFMIHFIINKYVKEYNFLLYKVNHKKFIFLTIINIFLTAILMKKMYDIALNIGPVNNLSAIIGNYRIAHNHYGFRLGIFSYINIFIYIIGLYMSIILAEKILFKNNNANLILVILNIFISLFVSFLSSGRGIVLDSAFSFIFVWIVIFGKKNKFNFYSQFKILKILSILLIIFLIFFYLQGKFVTLKVTDDIFEQISLYAAGPLVAFNDYLSKVNPISSYFGENTFIPIYNTLSQLGYDVPTNSAVQPFIAVGNQLTNIYTIYKQYIMDFGIASIFVFQFIYGYFHTLLYLKAININKLWILIYSMFVFPLIMQFNGEMYMTNMYNHLKRIIVLFMVYWVAKKIGAIKFSCSKWSK